MTYSFRDFQRPGRSPVFATNGMCATSHPLAASTAIDVLRRGGNAVDAAIAGAVLLGICEPQSTGIGGDCFVLLRTSDSNKTIALNGSGRAPRRLCPDVLRDSGLESIGTASPHAVTIPGAIDAFCRLSADWGKLGLDVCLEPAIRYADDGVPVSPRVASDWMDATDSLTGHARSFYLIRGRSPGPGTLFRAPKQAEVLRRIARHGRKAFYEGEIAQDMVDSLKALGGFHEIEDFANTACSYVEPIFGKYENLEITEHPPNSQGATALLAANILEHFDLHGLEPFGATRTHLETEAIKLAMDARDRFIADPDYATRMDHMLASETATRLAQLIDPRVPMDDPRRTSDSVHKETVYLTVVDRDRMSVSMIYSIFHSFGSGLASSRFGINFQNRGAGFTLEKDHPNEARGGKRPLHTIIPAFLRKEGEFIMPFGVMGGQYQPAGHLRFVANLANYGMTPQEAIEGPRSFPEDGWLNLERTYSASVRQRLERMGHRICTPQKPLGGGQAIMIHERRGVLEGGSDHRKDGCALGY